VLLTRKGDIVDVDGVSPVYFKAEEGDYYVTIRHRNHLGIMTDNLFDLDRSMMNPMTVNLMSAAVPTYGANGRKTVGDAMVMWGGNADADGYVIFQGFGVGFPDGDSIFFDVLLDPDNTGSSYNHIITKYALTDTNMDGDVKYQGASNDVDAMIFFNVIQHPENINFFINFFITQQIPN